MGPSPVEQNPWERDDADNDGEDFIFVLIIYRKFEHFNNFIHSNRMQCT